MWLQVLLDHGNLTYWCLVLPPVFLYFLNIYVKKVIFDGSMLSIALISYVINANPLNSDTITHHNYLL